LKNIFVIFCIILIEKQNGSEFKLAQSGSIVRYLAKKFELTAKTEQGEATIESIQDFLCDIRTAYNKAHFAPENEKAALTAKFFNEQFPGYLTFVEKILKNNGSNGHFYGNTLTYVDLLGFLLYEALNLVRPDSLNQATEFKKVYEKIAAEPKIVAYLKSDRRHPQ